MFHFVSGYIVNQGCTEYSRTDRSWSISPATRLDQELGRSPKPKEDRMQSTWCGSVTHDSCLGDGDGETAVLSYAVAQPGWKAVVDDGAVRRCAYTFAIPLLGALSIILRARLAGLIAAAAPLSKAVKAEGIRLDDGVSRTALNSVCGESWE